MSIKKQYLKAKSTCKVTFALTKKEVEGAEKVVLCGDFNDWDLKKDEMTRLKNGNFKIVKELSFPNRFQFRYLVNGRDWKNDPEADDYEYSGVSSEQNCVLSV